MSAATRRRPLSRLHKIQEISGSQTHASVRRRAAFTDVNDAPPLTSSVPVLRG